MTAKDTETHGAEAADPAADRLLGIYAERKLARLPDPQATDLDAPLGHRPGDPIGPYTLLEHLADGGMGEVWMAERSEPFQLRVALKIIKIGMDTRAVVARFEAEREALALMDHPHIARILDGGATKNGRPYFVMELVQGVPITEYCDQARLTTRQRLELFITVCEAVQHAHQRGIIHRDLKPGNILVANHDGKPLAKVIDFGIAKATSQRLTERTLFTNYGCIVGTFAYMGPEQAEFTVEDVDTRTDLYSLGCLLYELLTGSPPFDEAQLRKMPFDQVCKTIRETDPAKPSTKVTSLTGQKLATLAARQQSGPRRLRKALRGDLDRIVQKALEKNRKRRYQTALGFANDVARYLHDEAVQAGPPSAAYRLEKFARRHKGALGAIAVVSLSLVLGLGFSLWKYTGEKRARLRAEEAEQSTATVADFLSDMLKGADPSIALGRDPTLLREILDHIATRLDTDLADQPAVEGRLRNTIGQVYLELGEYELGEATFLKALNLNRQAHGTDHLQIAESLDKLANALRLQGRLRRAERHATDALEMRQRLVSDGDLTLASSYATLGDIFRAQGRYPDSEKMHRHALELRQKTLGNFHSDVASSLNDLGLAFHYAGDLDEALVNYRKAIEIERILYGHEHPSIAIGLHNLAVLLAHQGNLEESEKTHREALDLYEKMLGMHHPALARPIRFYAEVLRARGKEEELEELVHDLIERVEKNPGEGAEVAVMPGIILFEHYASSGNLDAALALRRWLMERPEFFSYNDALAPLRMGVWLTYLRLDSDFEALCRRFCQYAQTTSEPTPIERAAKLILIHPDPPQDLMPIACQLAQRAVDLTPDHHRFSLWFQSTLGLARVRAGEFARSEAALDRALTSQRSEARSLTHAVQAISQHYQGLHQRSRQSLSDAERELGDLAFTSHPELDIHEFNFLVAWMLIREARALLSSGEAKWWPRQSSRPLASSAVGASTE